VIGKPALVSDLRQRRFRSEHPRRRTPNELNGSIFARRHPIRLTKLARQMDGMDIHRVCQRRYCDTLLRVIEQTTRTHGQHSIPVLSRTDRRE
jgi:hypothetical protein